MKRIALLLLVSVASAAAAETRYSYDKNGRLTRVDYADGRAIVYTYDASGNRVRREMIVPEGSASSSAAKTRQQKRAR